MPEENESQTPDTVLDEYPVPDPFISPRALTNLGCTRKDLLALSADRASELVEDMTVYAVLPESGLEMPVSQWDIRQYPPGTVFAVPKQEWEKSMAFHMALNERTGRQTQRERAFLRHRGDCFAVYQFQPGADADKVPLETARKGGLSPRQSHYELVYTAPVTGSRRVEEVEKWFRERPPADFHHRGAQVGDIIAVKKDGAVKAWYLDRFAFSELSGMFEKIPLYRTGEHGEHLPMTDEIPLYRQTGEYAQEHGELGAYFASQDANIACRDAIDRAVAANYHDCSLNTDAAVRQVREEFGHERMLYVLAFSIRHFSWDGRISRDNIQWAENYPVTPDVDSSGTRRDQNLHFLISKTHPGLLDMFAKAARLDYERSRPLSAEEITGEAERIFTKFKTLEGPNGPNYQSFVVQFPPEFASRANGGDYTMLSSMMPFKSFQITLLRDFYSSGLFAQIAGEESRGPRRRLKPPSYQPKRTSTRRKKGPER